MNEINLGMKVYCDLHHKSKIHTVTGLDEKNGWAIIDGKFQWPIKSCFPYATSRRCAVCGCPTYSGFLFDGTTCLCSKHCATKFFAGDEGCVEILIDDGERLVWQEEFPIRDHYRVNIGHFATECFHHFDNEDRMFQWISEMIGEKVSSFEDCEEWTRKQDDEKGRYIEILCIDNIPEFYKHRREYVQCLQDCDDLMTKAQRLPLGAKRDYLIRRFGKRYEDANWYWDAYPEIWQGEI